MRHPWTEHHAVPMFLTHTLASLCSHHIMELYKMILRIALKCDGSICFKMQRPYLKCGLTFHWHIPSEEVSNRIVKELADFFLSNGFLRKRKPPTWNPKSRKRKVSVTDMSGKESCEEEKKEAASASKQVERNEEDHSNAENGAHRSVRNAIIGTRSVLRAMQDGRISMVFVDAAFLRPSAVGTAFALYALSCSRVRVYALQGLDATLSKVLNVRTVGAVGLREDDQTNPISSVALSELLPVERISSRKSGGGVSLAAAQLTISSGRREKKKKKEKKRKKKQVVAGECF
uniref:Uncharacterized protein n=1 Tax=Parascaris univalens TaxID=6257 RepID=A0A915BPK2_PARUN